MSLIPVLVPSILMLMFMCLWVQSQRHLRRAWAREAEYRIMLQKLGYHGNQSLSEASGSAQSEAQKQTRSNCPSRSTQEPRHPHGPRGET